MQQKMGIKVLPLLLFEIKVKVYREAAEQSWDLLDKDEDQPRLAGIQLSFTRDNFAADNITTSLLFSFLWPLFLPVFRNIIFTAPLFFWTDFSRKCPTTIGK